MSSVDALKDIKEELKKRKDVSGFRFSKHALFDIFSLMTSISLYYLDVIAEGIIPILPRLHFQTLHLELIQQLQNHLYLKASSAKEKVQLFRSGMSLLYLRNLLEKALNLAIASSKPFSDDTASCNKFGTQMYLLCR